MDEIKNIEVSDEGVYEIGFLFSPAIAEDKMAEFFGAFKDSLISFGAEAIIGEEFPKLIPLSYTMEKSVNNKIERFKEGWFGWVKIETDPSNVSGIDAKLRLRADIIRHLLVATTRENTIASKRPFGIRRRPGKDEPREKDAPEMSKEEIDREIDALVVEKEV